MKKTLFAIGVIAILLLGFYALNSYIYNEKQANYTDIEYRIEGEQVRLGGSTKYFGSELRADLNGDSREDIAFVVTYEGGGSGTFFYAVAALDTPEGYVGSDGYFLGDRIAPQSTSLSPHPRHKNVVVFNYADRLPGQPMTAAPSVGKSVYLKMTESMQWGIVEPDFEGESR